MQHEQLPYRDAGAERNLALALPADRRPIAAALFAHCRADPGAVRGIAEALTREGLAVATVDLLEPVPASFAAAQARLSAAAAALVQRCHRPLVLLGHSLAGTVLLTLADQHGEAIVTLGAAAGAESYADCPAAVGLEREAVLEQVRSLHRPLLLLHSPLDTRVDIDNATQLFVAAHHPKSFIALDASDHRLAGDPDPCQLGRLIGAWVHRYLPEHKETERETERSLPTLCYTGAHGFRTEITAAGHSLVADEPKRLGGTNQGPSPYDLLAAALGACTSMTLRLYADHKGLPLHGVTVAVRHDKVHAEDCADTEHPGQVDRLRRAIELHGELDEATRERLLEIADRCPVHRTLHSDICIESRLAGLEELHGDQPWAP